MKGYNTLKEFVNDYKLYLGAKRIDPGRDGETITSFFKNRIESRLKNSTERFKSMLKKNKFTNEDLKIMATHDVMGEIPELRSFVRVCFGDGYISAHYKKIISTNAFKSGRLKKIYEFIPLSIKSKRDLLDFIRNNRGITKSELNTIMNQICTQNWRAWIEELNQESKIAFRRGCITI